MSDDFIAQGRRHLVCGEIAKAVDSFQKACEILAAEHGDLDEKLGEPNLLYGTALLELARMESTVIGNALDGVPEDTDESASENDMIEHGPEMTEEQKDELSNEILDAMCEKETESASLAKIEESEAAPVDGEDNTESKAIVLDENNEGEEAEEENEGEEEENEEENNEDNKEESVEGEDISNLQLAWEVLEVAKKIFSQNESNSLKVAECLEKLGELSREKEDYTQAVSDLKECLSIRSSLLPSDSREIAETHYQLGTTHAVAGDFDSASSSFRQAASCLKEFVGNLKSKIDALKDEENSTGELDKLRSTLKEVQDLLPEVERRCADVEEDRLAATLNGGPSTGQSELSNTDNGLPKQDADDISHLVRKKRKAEESSEETTVEKQVEVMGATGDTEKPELKKSKLDENGSKDEKIAGATNGHTISEVA